MNDYSSGHRERVRERYLKSENALSDYELLELLLTFSIPRMDVKPLAKDLINQFNSLENVFNAPMQQLMNINGIGEKSAILISLYNTISKMINEEKNSEIKEIDTPIKAKEYVNNVLSTESKEKILVVCLDNSSRVISHCYVADGTVNMSQVNSRKVLEIVMANNASNVIVAHNHPKGSEQPSLADVNFTIEMRNVLNTIGVSLADHIVVGESKCLSMRGEPQFVKYFD